MESFYGGLRGLSFNLVRSYTSKSEMLIDFLSSSCSVGYGEYVIIDSSTSENGDVYKRTSNLSVDNGAVYITKLSGSGGQSASLNFATNYNTISATPSRLNLLNGGLVPGHYIENSEDYYNDDICFKTLKTTVNGNTETKIAFQFPYPVIDFAAETITNLSEPVIERVDNGTHPFYYSYLLKLPETVRQNQIYDIEKITVVSTDIIYDNPQDKNNITEDYIDKVIFIYKLKEISAVNIVSINSYFLSDCDFIQNITYNSTLDKIEITYDNTTTEIPLKQVTEISLGDDGLLSVSYSNDSGSPHVINQDNPIKWIEDIEYDEETGKIEFTYNTEDVVALPFSISSLVDGCVTAVALNQTKDKLLIYKGDNLTPEAIDLYALKQISNIVIQNDGDIVYTYTDGSSPHHSSSDNIYVRWITDISFDQPNNQFIITYNTKINDPTENDYDTYTWQLKTIVSAVRDGTDLVINYNTGNPTRITDVFLIESLTNFTLNANTGALTVQTGPDPVEDIRTLGTISYVNSFSYDQSTGALTYSYQNEAVQNQHTAGTIKMLQSLGLNSNNQLVAQYNTEANPTVIGEMQANYLLNIELTLETSGALSPLSYLTTMYPNGYTPSGSQQPIPNACVGIGPSNNRSIYAFGYHGTIEDGVEVISENKEWYFLGKMSETTDSAVGQSSSETAVQNLPLGGLWFVTEEIEVTEEEEGE